MQSILPPPTCFNSQPPEGGWGDKTGARMAFRVSTHSRPKAAGSAHPNVQITSSVSTHSRPKAAGRISFIAFFTLERFNSQPPEGGWHRT